MKLDYSTFIISVILWKVDAFTKAEIHLINLMTSQRELDLTNQNMNEYPTETRMKKPSVDSIEHNIHYSGSVLCSLESLQAWSCKSCLKAAPQSDMKNITYFQNKVTETAGFVAVNTAQNTIVLVFRGARSTMNDLQFTDSTTVPYELIPAQAKVNRGILKTMESLSSQFLELVEQLLSNSEYQNYSLTLIGHSLGSAMAPLALIKLQNHFQLPWERFNLYSYGQSRIGNSEFANWFNSRPITAGRIANSLDYVTQYPSKASGSHVHHQNLYYIDIKNQTARFCRSDIFEDPDCFSYPNITEENVRTHIEYLGVRLQPKFAC